MPPTLLVLLAHPDDESFPLGGTLAKYAAQGTAITLVCATRGEKGIPGLSPAATARIRERELRAAAAVLEIADVRFLDIVDGELDRADPHAVIGQLARILHEVRPGAVITFGPDGISGHPDHVAMGHLATAAFDQVGLPGARLFYIVPSEATQQGCGVVPSQEVAGGPVAALDVGAYLIPKVRAAQQHASQNPPFPGSPEEEAGRMACHEYFVLVRPANNPLESIDDLFPFTGE